MQQHTIQFMGSAAAVGLALWGAACATTEDPQTYAPTTNTTSTTSPAAGTPTSAGSTTGAGVTSNTVAGVTSNTVAGVTSNTVTGGTTGTTGTTATVTGATGTTATVTGTSTTAAEDLCLTRPALTAGLVADFETYDGATDAATFGWTLYTDGAAVQRYAGLYANSDGTGTPAFSMVAGNASTWAASASNPAATSWGGGVGFWMGCVNASSFTGISLAVRGSTPTGNVNVSLSVDGGSVSATVPVTETFVVQQIPFTTFTNTETGALVTSTNGDNMEGLGVGASMVYVDDGTGTYVPEPGAYTVVVDDVTFY